MKVYFSIFFLTFSYLFSQNYYKGISISPAYGFYWAHSPNIPNLPAHAKKISLSFLFQTSGKQFWHNSHKFPFLSVECSITKADYNDLLGYIFGIGINYNRILWKNKKLRQYIRLGTGIGYVETVFQQVPGLHKVKPLSSHINGILNIGTFLSYNPKNKGFINFYLGLYHQSNGSTTKPNYGVNFVHIALETGLFLENIKYFNNSVIPEINKNWKLNIRLATSIKQKNFFIKQYLTNTLGLGLIKPNSNVIDWTFGIDVFRDPTLKFDRFNYYEINPWLLSVAIRTGLKYKIADIYLLGEFAKYLYNPPGATRKAPVYQRIGIAYQFHKNFDLGVFLKTHFANAEFIEYCITYTLPF